jgi:hypothetical protein
MSNAGKRTTAYIKGIPTSASQSSGGATSNSDPRVIVTNVFSPQISTADASDGGNLDFNVSPLVYPPIAPAVTEQIHNIVTEPIITKDVEEQYLKPEPPKATNEIELEALDSDLVDNAKLKRFRAKRADNVEITIDVNWLKHVIHVLLVNHSVTVTAADIHDFMAYFDEDCEIRTRKRKIVERDIEPNRCCGFTEKQREKIIEVIDKIIVSGLNLIKTAPKFIAFLSELGLSL